jgi:hypothetical protein
MRTIHKTAIETPIAAFPRCDPVLSDSKALLWRVTTTEGTFVGDFDGVVVGESEGLDDGTAVGESEGLDDGTAVGESEGLDDGTAVGESEGLDDGTAVGDSDGVLVGESEGLDDGTAVGESEGLDEGGVVGILSHQTLKSELVQSTLAFLSEHHTISHELKLLRHPSENPAVYSPESPLYFESSILARVVVCE